MFADSWGDNLFLFILLGPAKPIFVGSILLFYYKALADRVRSKALFIHLAIPGTYYLALITVRFFLKSDIPVLSGFWISNGFTIWMCLIFWYYFFVTRKEIHTYTKPRLIPRAYNRVRVLFYSLYFFLLQIPIWDLIHRLSSKNLLSENWTWFQSTYEHFFKYVGYYASYTYLHFLGYFVFLYAVSELPYIKKFLLPKQTQLKDVVQNQDTLNFSIEQYFYEKKAFKNPELTLDSCALDLGVSSAVLSEFIKASKNTSFKDFVNQLRIDEFKKRIHDPQFARYDLLGIALECGFKSKSTFHRVFKDKEGMTPSEYRRMKRTIIAIP